MTNKAKGRSRAWCRIVVALPVAGVALAAATAWSAEDAISGASPFGALADCGDFPSDIIPGSVNVLHSEVEPFVAVNPIDPSNIVAVWQQDRWSDGGARGNVAGVINSLSSGWEIVPIPGVTDCTDGPWERASDPWVTFSPDGTAYVMSLAFMTDPDATRPGGFGPNAMLVSRSTDGGLTWGAPITLVEDANPRFLHDKNSITADPTDSNYVYAVWDKLTVPTGTVINPENVFGFGFKGPIQFARTTDGGQTWERTRQIYDPGGNNQTIGNQIVVLPDGTIVDFFNEILNFRNDDGGLQFDFNLSLLRSPNQGRTWLPRGRPIRAAKLQSRALFFPFVGIHTPDGNQPVRSADLLFDVAVDPRTGTNTLYAVWQDASFSGVNDEIAFSQSTDGGLAWSTPVKINQTPTVADNRRREQAFIPSVDVLPNGIIAVTYYDFRNDEDTGEIADHFGIVCDPASSNCADPASWVSSEVRLTTPSFEVTDLPFARGYFPGDYVGLANDFADFLPVYAKSHGTDPASVFINSF